METCGKGTHQLPHKPHLPPTTLPTSHHCHTPHLPPLSLRSPKPHSPHPSSRNLPNPRHSLLVSSSPGAPCASRGKAQEPPPQAPLRRRLQVTQPRRRGQRHAAASAAGQADLQLHGAGCPTPGLASAVFAGCVFGWCPVKPRKLGCPQLPREQITF